MESEAMDMIIENVKIDKTFFMETYTYEDNGIAHGIY
jgi:hypothetical protein